MADTKIPDEFIRWAYKGRAELICRQASGEHVPAHEIFLGFSRHTPAVVSNGPAGLNASIKGVGFIPKAEYIQETLEAYLTHIQRGWRDEYDRDGLQLLSKWMYGDDCQERIDFERFGSLELACDHTWKNLHADPAVTMLFYQPPMISFEVRGRAEIHEDGSLYHRFLNAQHDVLHEPHPENWAKRPAYIFMIDEIYDNSATKKGFGRQIYKAESS